MVKIRQFLKVRLISDGIFSPHLIVFQNLSTYYTYNRGPGNFQAFQDVYQMRYSVPTSPDDVSFIIPNYLIEIYAPPP